MTGTTEWTTIEKCILHEESEVSDGLGDLLLKGYNKLTLHGA